MCCCSVGIIIMKHALFLFRHPLCSLSPPPIYFSSLFIFVPAFIHFQIPHHSSPVSIATCHVLVLTPLPLLVWPRFSTSPLSCSLPSRGAGVICALSLLGQRATGSGQGTLRAGFCPGGCPPVCPSLWPSSRAHPAPAPPRRAGPRDTKVHKLNTPLSSASVLPL